ncbi:Shikimate Kinase [Ectocarpus siliculosus]|uniref:Shikimate Kinase n=1 Tax=Ectocarpus siliculosus TaxID=2880 RepID=D8LTH1_ECTSI|nr:Shikimate Kinase [Ectocarpus siliculosus]|eukprot:CBN78012.1 Shikimate Kinase [Ectocarpus siliculosus]
MRRSAGLSMEVEPHVLRLQAAELGSRLRGTNVFFVGMMGTGKSTVARALADVMGRYIFLDTDTIIEELLGASVGEVFAKDGEEGFRSVESQVLDQVHSYVKMCVATGGGIVSENKNWGKMQTGMVVWLDMEPKDIFERLSKDPEEVAKRPLLAGDDPQGKLEELLEKRKPQYAQADVTVQLKPEDGVDDITYNVVNTILEFIDSNPPKWQKWKEKANAAGIEWA